MDMWNYWGKLTTAKGDSFIGLKLETDLALTAGLALAKVGQYVLDFNMTAATFLAQLYARDDIVIDNNPLFERVRVFESIFPAPNYPMAGRGIYPVQNVQSCIAIILAFRVNKKCKLMY